MPMLALWLCFRILCK